jgi:hypothetical protein|tara:strand:- start:653 stop:919 length:267 start_codon:yes stop_codon:yes gene_type:complete
MTPDEIHKWIADQRTKQSRAAPQRCPDGIEPKNWKNRNLVSAKLSESNFADFNAYRISHGINISETINLILTYFFHHAYHQRDRQRRP